MTVSNQAELASVVPFGNETKPVYVEEHHDEEKGPSILPRAVPWQSALGGASYMVGVNE